MSESNNINHSSSLPTNSAPIDIGPLRIGPLSVNPPLVLAPMSGVTCSAFRRLIRRENGSALGLVVTEFISVEGLSRGNPASTRLMKFVEEERPISIQIFGHDLQRMADAARIAEDAGAEIIDINCGCPVPKVVKRGGGCELMRQPDHLRQILEVVRQAIAVPLTLKIRAGWDDDSRNAVEIARMAEDVGVAMLTVHGRTRVQLYRGEADWDLIGAVSRAVSIPVLGSGDVVDAESARARIRSGAAGLMIGRGALANPWIFREVAAALRGGEVEPVPFVEIPRVLRRYTSLLLEDMPEKGAIGRLKQLASQVTRRVPGSSPIRQALCTSQSILAFLEVLERWEESLHSPTASEPLSITC